MSIRAQVEAYMLAHPEAKRRDIVAALNLSVKQVENARKVIKHGHPAKKPKPKLKTKPIPVQLALNLPRPHFLSVW